MWDFAFFASSLIASLLFGTAVGNGLVGIPLDERGRFAGHLLDLLQPYPLLIGLMTVAMFATHGALYLYLKTEGHVQRSAGRWVWHAWGVYLVLYMLATIATLAFVPRSMANFERAPWAAAVVVANVLAIANIPRAIFLAKYGQAFLSSCLSIVCQVMLVGVALFPNLVTASNAGQDGVVSLTIYNAASSVKTLQIMALIALIGMPMVISYTAIIYWTFRGKATPEGY
jgi:cytochrome d ubiquinol oxidase subunit II